MQRDAETTQSAKHAYSRVPEPSLQMVGSPPPPPPAWGRREEFAAEAAALAAGEGGKRKTKPWRRSVGDPDAIATAKPTVAAGQRNIEPPGPTVRFGDPLAGVSYDDRTAVFLVEEGITPGRAERPAMGPDKFDKVGPSSPEPPSDEPMPRWRTHTSLRLP